MGRLWLAYLETGAGAVVERGSSSRLEALLGLVLESFIWGLNMLKADEEDLLGGGGA